MRLDPGSYKATRAAAVTLMRSNSAGSRSSPPPATVNYRVVPAGEVFEIPETVGPFYFTIEDADSGGDVECAPVPATAEV